MILGQEKLLRFPFIFVVNSYLFIDLHIIQNWGLVFHTSLLLLSPKAYFYACSCFLIALSAASLMHKTEHLNKLFKKCPENTDYCRPWGKKVTLNILCLHTPPLASAAGLRHGARFQRPLICSIGYYELRLISTTSLPSTVF